MAESEAQEYSRIISLHDSSEKVLFFSKKGLYLKLAVFNAPNTASFDRKAALSLQFMIDVKSLTHAGIEMEKEYILCRFCSYNVQDVKCSAGCIDWLQNITSGVYLRNRCGKSVEDGFEENHLVTIDRGKRHIWNCVERYGIKPALKMISHCVRESAKLSRAKELKTLKEQRILQ